MSNIKNLKYNDIVVENLNYEGSVVNKALYNNVAVYQNDGIIPEPDDPVDTTVRFELYPEFVPHNNRILQPVISSGDTYNIPEFYLVGNANFFIRMDAANTNDITVVSSYGSLDYVYKFEDYGFGFLRSFGYNIWRGGSSSVPYEGTVTFTPSADNSLSKSLIIHSNADEDNTTFFRGLFTSKLIRVPALGLATRLTLQFYPYNFESEYYYNSTKGYIIEDNVGDTVDDTLIKVSTVSETSLDSFNDGSAEVPMSAVDNGLECAINISIQSNITGKYKKTFLHFTRESDNVRVADMCGAEVHFVQEYYSNNRIYYGNVPKQPNYWESYASYGHDDSKYDYIFQFTNSEIVTDRKEISVKASENTSARQNVLCVPVTLNHTISPNNYTPLSGSYLWGDQEYIIYSLTSSSDITYILQIS